MIFKRLEQYKNEFKKTLMRNEKAYTELRAEAEEFRSERELVCSSYSEHLQACTVEKNSLCEEGERLRVERESLMDEV